MRPCPGMKTSDSNPLQVDFVDNMVLKNVSARCHLSSISRSNFITLDSHVLACACVQADRRKITDATWIQTSMSC